jgi:hypothetical protein
MGGGKGRAPSAPPPIDPGKSMGEYLFGKDFTRSYQGITDPRLQDRLIGAEATYRPQYTALELADIGVMARGLEEREVADPRYTQAQERISELQAELAKTPKTISTTTQIGKGRFRGRSSRSGTVEEPNPKRAELEREIASQQKRLSGLSPTKMQSATPGLFDLLEEQSRRAGVLQREELQLQRESDVGALRSSPHRLWRLTVPLTHIAQGLLTWPHVKLRRFTLKEKGNYPQNGVEWPSRPPVWVP